MTTPSLKNPPHSEEAERSTLGSVLIDPSSFIKIADFLSPEDFYDQKHGLIFSSMLSLWNKSTPIDLLTLTSELKDQKHLKKIGDSIYLTELTESVPTSSHIFEYAQIIKEKSLRRRLIQAAEHIKGLSYTEEQDTTTLLEETEKSIFSLSQTTLRDKFVSIKDVLQTTYERLAELHAAEDKSSLLGVPSGFPSLDSYLTGLRPSEMIILAARPSMGKTSFALSISQNVALQSKKSIGIFSLEMSKEQLIERLFCGRLGVNSHQLNTGNLSDDSFSRIGRIMDELSQAKIFIDDSAGNLNEIRSKSRRLQLEHGLDLIIIDYLQLISTGNNAYAGNRVQEISEISRSLKNLARELHVPIIALSQLSRAVENRPGKIPQLADLRESGAIEQDADVVLMMYREDYYEEDCDRPGITDIYIRKHRNGPTGKIELMFRKEQMQFYDIDRKHKKPLPSGSNPTPSPATAPDPTAIGLEI